MLRLKKLLFVCSRNKWRSLTAETIFKKRPGLLVKSAGTERSARIVVTAKMIIWADIIFVMERRHKEKLLHKFPQETAHATLITLDIPDTYRFMEPELIDEIQLSVSEYI
ncbi:MAG: protein tyrosine phosphatase [Sphingobacteriales bacterium]|nr:MAG: protein tyrosine phosphatase [Sphingobacteriales bacterium]